jgi:hypothetical protein
MSLLASGSYNYTNCITGSQSDVTVPSGQVVCVSKTGKVTNGINVKSGGVLLVNGGSVTGGIKASGAAGINFCGGSISGGVNISGSTGEVVIGDGSGCAGNVISAGLTLGSNTAGIQVIANNITGGFAATSNTGSIATGTLSSPGPSGQYVEVNSGSGGMSCAGNSPALTDGANPNTIIGSRSGQCPAGF